MAGQVVGSIKDGVAQLLYDNEARRNAMSVGMCMQATELLEAFAAEPQYKEHADALLPALLPLHAQMSPDTYGGAVLLGVDGICIISHGSSGQTAIVNAMKLAHELAGSGMVAEIAAAFAG